MNKMHKLAQEEIREEIETIRTAVKLIPFGLVLFLIACVMNFA